MIEQPPVIVDGHTFEQDGHQDSAHAASGSSCQECTLYDQDNMFDAHTAYFVHPTTEVSSSRKEAIQRTFERMSLI